jgi:hypothetical protein
MHQSNGLVDTCDVCAVRKRETSMLEQAAGPCVDGKYEKGDCVTSITYVQHLRGMQQLCAHYYHRWHILLVVYYTNTAAH